MIARGNVGSNVEQPFDVCVNVITVLQRIAIGESVQEFFAVAVAILDYALEVRVRVGQSGSAAENVLFPERQREDRLDTARAPSDHRDRASGSYRQSARVAHARM